MKASIIICTYNRTDLLVRLLDSATRLRLPEDLDWELLVIDNNSRDATRECVAEYQAVLPLKYEFEPMQGKTFALNRGIAAASGDLLCFADDDVELDRGWLEFFIKYADKHPEHGWFGGRVKPNWCGNVPGWYRAETAPVFSGYLVDYDQGDVPRPFDQGLKLPLGASLALRCSVFDRIGGFRTDVGPRGTQRGVGDDTELLQRAIARGISGLYVPQARVWHHVGPERLKLSGFLTYGIGKGLNHYRMGTESGRGGSLLRAGSQLLRAIPQALKGRGDRARICLINAGIELGRFRGTRERAKVWTMYGSDQTGGKE